MATFFAAFFLATFFTAFLAGAFFATFFLAAAFFAGAFFAAFFLATIFNSRRDGDLNLTTCYLKFKLLQNDCHACVVKPEKFFAKKFIEDEVREKQIPLGKFHLKIFLEKIFSNDFLMQRRWILPLVIQSSATALCAKMRKKGALMFYECARLNKADDA